MPRLSAALVLAALVAAGAARAKTALPQGLGFLYVTSNVGTASGGHAALVADGVVYHLQNGDDDLLLLVRDGWSAFDLYYAGLQNRPLTLAMLDVAPEVTERVQRGFSRLYVEQELELARRESLRDDVRWLEAFEAGQATPPLRGAGLLAPERAGDLDALALRADLEARAPGSVARFHADAERALDALGESPDPGQLAELREALLAREAARALDAGYGLDPRALAALPADADEPLAPTEREALEGLVSSLTASLAKLLVSSRPDRGAPLLLTEARVLAARRSLATNHWVLLDAFSGWERARAEDDASPRAQEKRRAQASALVRKGRATLHGAALSDEANLNLLEEVAAIAARDGRADAVGSLSEVGQRKLPARARALESPHPSGDLAAALATARARLRDEDALMRARWGYDLVRRNCITELGRTTDAAFASPEEVAETLGARASPDDEPFGFVPFVFFERVRERMRVAQVVDVPNHRQDELERLLRESPGALTRLRESGAYTSSIYEPRLRDSAFLFFTDDVFWRRPAYGAANLAFALGYSVYGLGAAPFDRGRRLSAGLAGVMWSVPELAFQNVRKGSFDWAD